jgi:hypothetical protein
MGSSGEGRCRRHNCIRSGIQRHMWNTMGYCRHTARLRSASENRTRLSRLDDSPCSFVSDRECMRMKRLFVWNPSHRQVHRSRLGLTDHSWDGWVLGAYSDREGYQDRSGRTVTSTSEVGKKVRLDWGASEWENEGSAWDGGKFGTIPRPARAGQGRVGPGRAGRRRRRRLQGTG